MAQLGAKPRSQLPVISPRARIRSHSPGLPVQARSKDKAGSSLPYPQDLVPWSGAAQGFFELEMPGFGNQEKPPPPLSCMTTVCGRGQTHHREKYFLVFML